MRYWVIAVLLAAAAAPARADVGESLNMPGIRLRPNGAQEIAITVGGFHPTGVLNFTDKNGKHREVFGGNGFEFAFDYLHRLYGPIALGGEYAYLNRGERNVNNPFTLSSPATDVRVRGDTQLFMALVRLRQPGVGWRPYVIGGIGFHKTHLDLYSLAPAVDEVSVIRDDVTDMAWIARAGLERVYANGGFIGFEAGYLHTQNHIYQETQSGPTNGMSSADASASGLTYDFRLGIRFGGGS